MSEVDVMERYRAQVIEKAAWAIWSEVDGPLGSGVYPAEVTGHDREKLRAEAALDAADFWGAVERIEKLTRERDELAQRLKRASANAEAAEAEVARLSTAGGR